VVNPAAANPNPAPNRTTALSVLGNDDGGEANLKYTWSVVGTPPGSVSFSANGTNAAKTTAATFGAEGTYNLLVTIADASGNTRTSSVTVKATTDIAWYQNDVDAGPTLPDSFGNNLGATASGSYAIVPGVSGNAVQFTGGYAALPANVVNGITNFTIATWLKLDSLGTFARVFDIGTGTTNYMFLTPQSATNGYPRFAIRTASVNEQQINSTSLKLPTGSWAHVAVTLAKNGSASTYTGTLYVNGAAAGTNAGITLTPSSLGATTQNYIGESQFSADPTLMGSIDDFRIYARALSAAEVKGLAGGTVSGTAFNDVNANNAFDTGEPALDGVQLYLDANNNGVLDAGELSTTTSDGGKYSFSGVPAGSYFVREVAPAAYAQTAAPSVTVGNATAATADVPSAQIVYTGTANSDVYTLRKNGSGQYEIVVGGSVVSTVAATVPSLTFNLGDGDDTLVVDHTSGSPVPAGGVFYDGGNGTGDEIQLIVPPDASAFGITAGQITSGGRNITYAGAEEMTLTGGAHTFLGDAGAGLSLSVAAETTATFNVTQHLAGLAIAGAVDVPAGGTRTIVTGALSFSGSGRLDLRDNALAIDYSAASPIGTFSGGAYTGVTGNVAAGTILTSMSAATPAQHLTALGVAEAADALHLAAGQTALWNGQTVDSSTVLVKYTYAGDVDLNGKINGDDYFILDSHAGQQLAGNSMGWFYGDVDYNGKINGDDFFALDSNLARQGVVL
jgi:hypothetical protein